MEQNPYNGIWIPVTDGHDKVMYEGYIFNYEKMSKTDEDTRFYSCYRKKSLRCKARLHICNNTITKLHKTHNHTEDSANIEKSSKFRAEGEMIRAMESHATRLSVANNSHISTISVPEILAITNSPGCIRQRNTNKLKTQNQINEEYDVGDTQNVQISKQTHRFSTHFVGGNGPTRDHPDPLPVRPMNVLHSSAGYIDAGPSNQVFSGKPENPRRKKIAAATVSSAPVLIPDDSPPQPSPAKIQKKQIDDRRFDEQRFQEQRFQERRFENRRFDDRRQMVNTQVSQMAAKTLQAQMPVQQHMSVAQVSQNITRPVQVLAPPIQISEPKPKPVEKPRPREKRIFVVADHQRCVMSNLASLWKSGKLCDAGIGNGSSTVMVHKVVLSAVCPKLLSVFSTDILSHKFLQVNFPEEVSTEALNAFAEYMYNGLLDIDPDILHQLKIIAKRLDMKEFEQLCDSRLPSTIPQQPASTVTVFGDLSQMQTILSNPPSITVPTVQPSLPSSSITSVTSQSAPSVTTQVIDVKQEISEAELAQVKKDTAAVFGQESEVASLDASKSGNSSGGFVIVPSVKTEPVGPEDDRYGQLNNQSYASTPVSISSRIPGTGLNSTVVSSSEFVLPFSDTTDSNTTNVLQGTSKLKSNVFESSLVSDLSPVSCIVEKMCSQSSPIREDPSKPLNRTITTQSIDNIVTSGSNEGVYPVGLFTAGGDSLPLSSTQVTNVKNIGLYKTDGLT
ncbi:uncharacterized protein LOC106877732 isoform X9 [Octopus bimaculoides]|uniref:uncharacterized protein LOC106877732 isoform X9 n=1 Tax=Octopus bimaculoides TaxID=37653 RepID=UPI00071E2FC4|nr:uncharacterized protein LOC106877732 isoform X9 [Octopus bimaculoides]|eukprot:XP_014782198.1 PREDICTED: uncharacterized protein LOC106877732 isoform X8 [Octopus bimaculoides]